MLIHTQELREDHAQRGDLGNRQIDEDDAAGEHFRAERNMRGKYDESGQAGGSKDAEIEAVPIHLSTPSNLSIVES